MNKIGFQIKRVSAGASDGITVNDGEWSRKVVDSRDVIKLCDVNGGGRFIMFMSFGVDGTYLTVMRPITGRDGDNVAAWMYIPNEIDIDGATIADLVAKVKNELLQPQSNGTFLERLFAQTYPKAEAVKNAASTIEKVYAVRRVGAYPLETIFGVSRYQPYYTKYNAVIIEDTDSMRVIDKNVADLSRTEIKSMLVFCPPVKTDLPLGVSVSYEENKKIIPFTSPIRALQGQIVRIRFSKHGFDDIKFDETIWENQQICGVPKSFEWMVTIPFDRFKVVSKSAVNLTNKAVIKVNEQQAKFGLAVKLSERDARNARVKVTCNGYEPAEKEVDFISEQTVSFTLKRKIDSIDADIELVNGSIGKMTLMGRGVRTIKDAPIKGYRMNERGWLEYDAFDKWKNICIGFFSALLLMVLIWGGIKLYDVIFGEETEGDSTRRPGSSGIVVGNERHGNRNDVEEIPAVDKYKAAIEYLDTKTQWVKADMDNIAGLEGLYDLLNTYQFQQVLTTINELGCADIIKENGQIKYLKDQINKYVNYDCPNQCSYNGTITVAELFKKLENLNTGAAKLKSNKKVSSKNKPGLGEEDKDIGEETNSVRDKVEKLLQ